MRVESSGTRCSAMALRCEEEGDPISARTAWERCPTRRERNGKRQCVSFFYMLRGYGDSGLGFAKRSLGTPASFLSLGVVLVLEVLPSFCLSLVFIV